MITTSSLYRVFHPKLQAVLVLSRDAKKKNQFSLLTVFLINRILDWSIKCQKKNYDKFDQLCMWMQMHVNETRLRLEG